jgi:hypothetical protein
MIVLEGKCNGGYMRNYGLIFSLVVGVCFLAAPIGGGCQTNTTTERHAETEQELETRMTADQTQQFQAAKKAQLTKNYAEASAGFKALQQQFPDDLLLKKWSADAALSAGDSAYALGLLKPVFLDNVEDRQIVLMVAQSAAESGDLRTRNAAMYAMGLLRKHGMTPPNQHDYVLERVKVGDNLMTIWCSLVPWGPYNTYYFGMVTDAKGVLFLSISLESSDFDQVPFAKQHPKEAAAGTREFTLDAYRETGLNQSGQRTQTHFTYKFFMGQPPYDVVREEFINIANGKTQPVSHREGVIVVAQ